jgi:hypothetical protein
MLHLLACEVFSWLRYASKVKELFHDEMDFEMVVLEEPAWHASLKMEKR